MTTIADLEEEQLKQHLISGGFLAPFTDIFGASQPAPKTQVMEFDLTNLQPDERIVMIRTIGNVSNTSTNVLFTQRNMLVAVVGNIGSTSTAVAKGLAVDMEKWLKANITDNKCIFNITSSGVSGPFTFDDSRRVYEINIMVSFNIERPIF